MFINSKLRTMYETEKGSDGFEYAIIFFRELIFQNLSTVIWNADTFLISKSFEALLQFSIGLSKPPFEFELPNFIAYYFLRCEALYSSRARTHPQSIICVAMFSTTAHHTNIVQTLLESLSTEYEPFFVQISLRPTVCPK